MPSQSNERPKASSTFWQVIERSLLIVTFLFALIGTIYSVRTAQKALFQAEVTLRPWIAIPNVNTHVEATYLETSIDLLNIGQVPAHLRVFVSASFDGKSIRANESVNCMLLPGQSIQRDGLTVKGDLFHALRDGPDEHRISQRIHVQYGTQEEDLRYESMREVALTSEQFRQLLNSPTRTGFWKLVGEDFK